MSTDDRPYDGWVLDFTNTTISPERASELADTCVSFPWTGDARMEWMKTLTHAEFKACMYELDRRYLADKAEEERRVREQAEADAAADGPNAPKRYFTSFKADTGIDLDAELWEYGIMDGNLKEYRMRIYHERQAKLFESPEHRKTLQDVRVFQMRSAIGH